MTKELAIVLVSGGMDSCVTSAIAGIEYNMAFLHINYGQRTEKRELTAFNEIADFYDVQNANRMVADISYIADIGGSSLTDKNIEVEHSDDMGEIPNTYVPFRNTHFLSIAVSWAEVIHAKRIFIGAVAQDNPGYPDCNEKYYNAFNKLVEIGTKTTDQIEVLTPIINLRKSQIVQQGVSLNAPLHLTWSCYDNSELACGKCNSCVLRLDAFNKAGFDDPVKYVN